MQIGAVNTAVLLVSSLTMALAVFCVRTDRLRPHIICLLMTAALGACFVGLKAYEYVDDYSQGLVLGRRFDDAPFLAAGLPAEELPHIQLFLLLYWTMTATHALHMVIGVAMVLVIAVLAWSCCFDARYYGPVDVTALYWHFVDLIWIFLFPMLCLLGIQGR